MFAYALPGLFRFLYKHHTISHMHDEIAPPHSPACDVRNLRMLCDISLKPVPTCSV